MQKNVQLPLDSFKEKLFETILKPLREENLSKEYHYQLSNMTNFHQRFCALEGKYAQIYAQAISVEHRLNNLKNSDSTGIDLSKNQQKISAQYAY
ncbi:MAG: hypothetical protein H0U49_02430 [Parachlamydiaceae bacterium]|nr:hypothetical protein [Parachlamydiaceae bacterium]